MYQCLSSRFPEVEKRMKSVINLIRNYGYNAEYEVFNKEIKEVPVYKIQNNIKTIFGTSLVEVVNYDFKMPDFKIGNYTPVAIIDHNVIVNDKNTNLVHAINNFNIPNHWWTIKGNCDDCKDKYSRKKTIMLQDTKTKAFRQIGTTCLKKYLGITAFSIIKNFTDVVEILEEEEKIEISFDKISNKYVDTKRFLGLVIDEIDKNGYRKK